MTLDRVRAAIVAASAAPSEALEKLRAEETDFAVVMDEDRPQALVTESQLRDLPSNRRLSDLDLPPLLAAEAQDFERDVVGLALLVAGTGAPGVLVLEDDKPSGVLPVAAIRDHLEPADIAEDAERSGLHGDPVVPLPTFVCQRCAPPSKLRPRNPDQAPICPRDPAHGPMSRE